MIESCSAIVEVVVSLTSMSCEVEEKLSDRFVPADFGTNSVP